MYPYTRKRFWLVVVPSHDDLALADFLAMVGLARDRGVYAIDWHYEPKRGDLYFDFGCEVGLLTVLTVCAAALPEVPCPTVYSMSEREYCRAVRRAANEG